jgi:hypothetical protein
VIKERKMSRRQEGSLFSAKLPTDERRRTKHDVLEEAIYGCSGALSL